MTNIRRYRAPNRPMFITAVCYQRQRVLKGDTEKARLLEVMREIKAEMPFQTLAYVILDDHFHWMIQPQEDSDLSTITQSVKLRFTHRYKRAHTTKGNLSVWQRRFWDHVARSDEDLARHLDYIHFNPVRHGYAGGPVDYAWSSFRAHVAKGYYLSGWAANGEPNRVAGMNLE